MISIEALISILGLLLGSGGGAFFTWRYMRRKARAEALQAEADAKKAEVDAAIEKQNYYQQIIEDVVKDRDYYKGERDEIRSQMDKFSRSVMEWKHDTDQTIEDLRRQVARNGRQLEAIRPFMCGDLSCKVRQRVTISESGEVKTKRVKPKADALGTVAADASGTVAGAAEMRDIEPLEMKDM